MDFVALYQFLFESYLGIGCLVGGGIVLSLIACIIMEARTRRIFAHQEKSTDDWSFFDDDGSSDEEEEK